MKIVEIVDSVTLAQLVRPDPHRTRGLHLSTIIDDMMRRLEPNRFKGLIKPEFIGVGQAFEDLIAGQLQRTILGWEKPGEFVCDGVIMSPDNLTGAGLEEIKVTWVKGLEGAAALQNPKLMKYHLQAKGYCRALGTDQMLFRVLFVNGPEWRARKRRGDFAPPFPTLRTFLVRYSPIEIATTWGQVLQHAEDVGLREGSLSR